MLVFKVLCSGYQDSFENDYKKGDLVKTTADLVKKFPGKFKLIEEEAKPVETAKTVSTGKPSSDSNKEVSKKNDNGKDVTDKYKEASEYSVKIFEKGKLLYIYDMDDMNNPINDKGIKPDKLSEFLETYGE